MALATQCPHCGTMFRVASDQLKLRGGIVRCGACQEIFDGSATLVDLDQPQARVPAPTASAPSSPEQATPAAAVAADVLPFTLIEVGEPDETSRSDEPDPDDSGELPVYTLDFGRTFEPFGILPKVAPAAGEARVPPETAVPAIDAAQAGPDPVAAGDALGELAQPELAQPEVAEAPQAVQPVAEEAVSAPVPVEEPSVEAAPDTETTALSVPVTTEPVTSEAVTTEPVARGSADTGFPATEPAAAETLAAEPEAAPATDMLPEPVAAVAAEPTSHATTDMADATVAATVADAPADTVADTAHFAPADESRAAPVPAGDERREPGFGPPDEELVAQPLADQAPAHAAHAADDTALLLMRESAAGATPAVPGAPSSAASNAVPGAVPARSAAARRAEKAAARRSKLVPTKIEAQPKLRTADLDEPEFVRRGRQQEQSGRTRKLAMLGGSLALLLLMLAQGAYLFRDALAARIPSAKPALVAGCAVLGCRVELPAQVDNLAIETGELTTLGGGAYSFTTELRNSGDTAQAWPSLELALTDADDKPLVRRVFAPRDYLGPGTPLANGIAPRTEQAITLHFRVDDLKPSGYHIAVFYP